MNRSLFTLLLLFSTIGISSSWAQDWMHVHVNYDGYEWAFPYSLPDFSHFDFDADSTSFQMHRSDNPQYVIPFALEKNSNYSASIDSITFSDSLTTKTHDKCKVFAMYITTEDGVEITSKEDYVRCYVSIDGRGEYQFNSRPGKIRGRGNSTWLWYDKKPYRIKFDTSSKVLGIEKNRDWVLLANYRDMTDMMNVFGSITATWMGIPFTTPVRFAEVFLNGEYIGVYQIAEQVEVAGNRVDIDTDEGVLLTLDVDDGPAESPNSGDNFYTSVYNMPMAVKYPKDVTSAQLKQIKADFAELENAIKSKNYALVDSLMDIPSYIAMDQLQEYLYNVELAAPRSIYLYRDKGGKYTFGPAWDWDAGFDFDWSDMYTGHTFFTSYTETLFGSDPYRQNGNYRIPKFFTDMFGNAQFMRQYKERWDQIKDSLFIRNWAETQRYVDGLNELQTKRTDGGGTAYTSPQVREEARWKIRRFSAATETQKLRNWLQNRLAYLNEIVASYPVPEEGGDGEITGTKMMGTMEKTVNVEFRSGYSQSGNIQIDKKELAALLDVESINDYRMELVPLDSDGSEGNNTAAGTYGAWFDENGDTNSWGNGHVYIESNNLYRWNYGCHPNNCSPWDGNHTVTMQYQYNDSGTLKLVNIVVTFHIQW